MNENKLMSMCDFVMLKSDELIQFKDLDYIEGSKKVIISHKIITNYAQFLQQTLELWMFVPCKMIKGAWVAIEEPTNPDTLEPQPMLGQDEFNEITETWMKYQQAKDRVLFEGVNIKTMKELFSIKENFELTYTVEDLMELCSFDDAPPTLTKTALKQIGL